MSLFAHYPAKPDTILAVARSLGSSAQDFVGLGSTLSGRTAVASWQVDGALHSPVSALARPITADVERLTSASRVAGGAVAFFARAVGTYNDGVDRLNHTYEQARSANFHVPPVADDATDAHGDPLSEAQRKEQHDGRVADARSALEHALRLREAALMRDLDDSAERTAGLLSAAPHTVRTAAGPDDTDGDGDSDRDESRGLLGAALHRAATFGIYLWDTNVRRVANPAQTVWDTATGTSVLEDGAAAWAILYGGGDLYREGHHAGEATYITGAVPGELGATMGHTVLLPDRDEVVPPPDPYGAAPLVGDDEQLRRDVEHGTQQVYDVEDLGAIGYYGLHAVQSAIGGPTSAERRADAAASETGEAAGPGGPVAEVIGAVDGTLHAAAEWLHD